MKAEEQIQDANKWLVDNCNVFSIPKFNVGTTIYEVPNVMEQYAELRIQQDREKWKEETKWISVKDELPKLTEENNYGRFSKPMLCLHSDGHLEDCQLNEGIDEDDEPYWSYSQDGELCETVTHWMNIPILPKSNQE